MNPKSPKGLNVNSPERKLGVYEPKIYPTLKGLNCNTIFAK